MVVVEASPTTPGEDLHSPGVSLVEDVKKFFLSRRITL